MLIVKELSGQPTGCGGRNFGLTHRNVFHPKDLWCRPTKSSLEAHVLAGYIVALVVKL